MPDDYDPERWVCWKDLANVLLGLWLFASPWLLEQAWRAADRNDWILGAAVVVGSIWGLARPASPRPEAANVAFGAWTFLAPWLLGFASVMAGAAWNDWIIGAAVTSLALIALSRRASTASGEHA